jgi:hypothetical protein
MIWTTGKHNFLENNNEAIDAFLLLAAASFRSKWVVKGNAYTGIQFLELTIKSLASPMQ